MTGMAEGLEVCAIVCASLRAADDVVDIRGGGDAALCRAGTAKRLLA
jgi:hypothetical protein